jgi:hypothetical protein
MFLTVEYAAMMNTRALEPISRNLTMLLNIGRFLSPALSVLSGLFPQQNQNPTVALIVGILTAILTYFLTTWWAEWVGRISAIALGGPTDQIARVRQISDTQGRWMTASQVILVIAGILGVIGLLIVGLGSGLGFILILIAILLGLVIWAGYMVIGWYKTWVADATTWVETQRVTYDFESLTKTLQNWYMASLVLSGISALVVVFSSLQALPILGTSGLISILLSLVSGVFGCIGLWYWREFFGTFTAHATATPAPNTATNPASL